MINSARAAGMLWLAWIVSWTVARLWSDRAAARPGLARQLPYFLVIVAGAVLLFSGQGDSGWPAWTSWRIGLAARWALLALVALGLLFTWWARLHLGRLWSSSVTRKADHRIVDTGPYGLVRHPIYTGLILAALATGAVRGEALGLAGGILLSFGMYLKARLEEGFLREQMNPEYDAYARRVPMLVPFARGRPPR